MNAGQDFRTPLKRAVGLGSAKDGTGHFLWQRVTAIGIVLAGARLLGQLLSLRGADYTHARMLVADPLNATILVAFLIAMFWHAQLGVQVVLEDYVHHSLLALFVQTTARFIAVLGAIVSVFAVARIALAG